MNRQRPHIPLILAGLIGLVACVLVLSRQHPDAAAPEMPSRQAAEQAALVFLQQAGIDTDDMFVVSQLERSVALIDALVREKGRPAAQEALQSRWIPAEGAYFWSVDMRSTQPGGAILAQVRLGHDLQLVGFSVEDDASYLRPDREALYQALTEEEAASLDLELLADSSLNAVARFARAIQPPSGESVYSTLSSLGRPQMQRLASYHLGRSRLAEGQWRLDELAVRQSGSTFTANYVLADSIDGRPFTLAIEGGADGRLIRLSTDYEGVGETTGQLVGIFLYVGLLILLGLVLLVLFIRRFSRRQIDYPSALIDAIVVGVALGAMLVLSRGSVFNPGFGPIWQRVLVSALAFGIASALMILVAFVVSGTTNSISRETWEHKLRSVDLIRRGQVFNQTVGASLVNGSALAFVVGAAALAATLLLPRLPFYMEASQLTDRMVGFPVPVLLGKVGSSFFIGSLFFLLAGSVFRRRLRSVTAVVILLTLLGAALRVAPVNLAYGPMSAIPHAVGAFVLALAFLRTDFVTCLVAMFISASFFDLAEPWLIGGEAVPGAMIAGLVLVSIPAAGIAGWKSRRTGLEAGDFTPPYLVEMAAEERLKREVEIAREVQESFLPKKMPSIAGLDVHGHCIPAIEVGGDYYDLIPLSDGRLVVVVGDVSGKGFQAAFYMTLAKGIVQTLASREMGPRELLCRFNELFYASVPRSTFISMACGIADPEKGTFLFARAGHNPLIHFRAQEGSAVAVQPSGMAVGFDAGPRFEESIEEVELRISPGDSVVLYTDGLSEAMDSARDMYGDERLRKRVEDLGGGSSARDGVHALIEDVRDFSGGVEQHDDMTLVVLSVRAAE